MYQATFFYYRSRTNPLPSNKIAHKINYGHNLRPRHRVTGRSLHVQISQAISKNEYILRNRVSHFDGERKKTQVRHPNVNNVISTLPHSFVPKNRQWVWKKQRTKNSHISDTCWLMAARTHTCNKNVEIINKSRMLTSPHFDASHPVLSSLNKRVGVDCSLLRGSGKLILKWLTDLLAFVYVTPNQHNKNSGKKTKILNLAGEKRDRKTLG